MAPPSTPLFKPKPSVLLGSYLSLILYSIRYLFKMYPESEHVLPRPLLPFQFKSGLRQSPSDCLHSYATSVHPSHNNVIRFKCKSDFFTPLLKILWWFPTTLRIKSRHLRMAHKLLPDLAPPHWNLISYHWPRHSGPAAITSLCLSSYSLSFSTFLQPLIFFSFLGFHSVSHSPHFLLFL